MSEQEEELLIRRLEVRLPKLLDGKLSDNEFDWRAVEILLERKSRQLLDLAERDVLAAENADLREMYESKKEWVEMYRTEIEKMAGKPIDHVALKLGLGVMDACEEDLAARRGDRQ